MSDGDGYRADLGGAKVDCYSGGEGEFMDWAQAVRGRLFAPLLRLLAELGVRANQVTYLSLLVGFAFCPLYLTGYRVAAFFCLLVHVVLDGLDGPLARFRGQASNRGSFTDTMVDQLVVTVTTLTMVHAGYASIWSGGLYVFFYAVVVGFAFVRNALCAPYSWLFRPRFVVYLWFLIETTLWSGTLEWVLWIATGILAMKSVTGFLSIRRRI
ncbi:MAG: CDP-alcohol phosphatidyltransferase family protein [Verrucomicrobiota bacterium]